MLSSKAFIAILILIAVIAAIYAPPKSLPIRLIYTSVTSPYNTAWNGTSVFYEELQSAGYRVFILNNLSFIDQIDSDKILLLIIAPERRLNENDISLLLRIMKTKTLKLVVADESTNSNYFLSKFGYQISGELLKDPASPYGLLHPVIQAKLGTNNYQLLLDRSSFLVGFPRDNWIGLKDCKAELNNKPVFKVLIKNDDAIAILSDSSIFINLFFKEELLKQAISEGSIENIQNKQFALDLVDYLTNNDKSHVIVFDNSHYFVERDPTKYIEMLIRLPLPPIGLLASLFAVQWLTWFDLHLRSIVLQNSIVRVLTLLIVAGIVYYSLRKSFKRTGDDEIIPLRTEIEVLLETPIRKRLERPEKLSKREKMQVIHQLYSVLNSVMRRYAGINLDKVGITAEDTSKFKSLMNEEYEKALEIIKRMRTISEKFEGKRMIIWPPILSWKSEMKRIIYGSETIAGKLRMTIIGREGMKGIEYKARLS